MKQQRPFLALPDYQRIYQVIYSVLEASGGAKTHRACLFFATAGMLILREHYKLQATLCVGSMALMVDEDKASVVVYGRKEGDEWIYDSNGFHAWVECNGWLIDFMAPIMAMALKEDGVGIDVPRNMLQKPLTSRKNHLNEIQHVGEFYCFSDRALGESVLDMQGHQFSDLLDVCLAWFRRPPKALRPMALGGTGINNPQPIALRAPSITGVW
jgi:hypothetical protein